MPFRQNEKLCRATLYFTENMTELEYVTISIQRHMSFTEEEILSEAHHQIVTPPKNDSEMEALPLRRSNSIAVPTGAEEPRGGTARSREMGER
jgi:hypothetical protein